MPPKLPMRILIFLNSNACIPNSIALTISLNVKYSGKLSSFNLELEPNGLPMTLNVEIDNHELECSHHQ